MEDNALAGLPDSLSRLTNLRRLYCEHNAPGFSVPESVRALPALTESRGYGGGVEGFKAEMQTFK